MMIPYCRPFAREATVLAFMMAFSPAGLAQRSASTDMMPYFDEVSINVDGDFIPVVEATPEQLATNPTLFEDHSDDHFPVLKPDGVTQVTYNEFGTITGAASILEVANAGTLVTVELSGLIPGGIYTIWNDYFAAPGFTPDFAHELGLGALGYDGNNPPANPLEFDANRIVADGAGRGQVEVLQPPGPPSWFSTELGDSQGFEIPEYALDPPVFELDLVVAYHLDGNTWGPRPGAAEGMDSFDETWVGQGIGVFVVPEPHSATLAALGILLVPALRRTSAIKAKKCSSGRNGARA
jgi:hypothetical protein